MYELTFGKTMREYLHMHTCTLNFTT